MCIREVNLTLFLLIVFSVGITITGTVQAESIHITFDPASLPGGSGIIDNWTENGMLFTGPNGLGHRDFGKESYPYNGTATLAFMVGPPQTMTFQFTNSTLFQLLSVDLAEYSTLFDKPKNIIFVGHKNDGSTVTQIFTVDGIIDGTGSLEDFETFTFGNEFKDISYVEVPTLGYSLDNVFLSPVPEPTTFLLFGLGSLTLRKRRRT